MRVDVKFYIIVIGGTKTFTFILGVDRNRSEVKGISSGGDSIGALSKRGRM